jgi:hypothetical protein
MQEGNLTTTVMPLLIGSDDNKDRVSEWDLRVIEEGGHVHVSTSVGVRLAAHNPDGPRLAALCALATDRSSIVERVSIHGVGDGRRGVVIELRAISESQQLAAARVRAAVLLITTALRSCPGPGEKTVLLAPTAEEAVAQLSWTGSNDALPAQEQAA